MKLCDGCLTPSKCRATGCIKKPKRGQRTKTNRKKK